jgi:ribokinase
MFAAVVGHVEWIDFVRIERIPAAGEIIHALEAWEEPGGGGAVSAVQLAKLAERAALFTALSDDGLGHRAYEELSRTGLAVEATFKPTAQRRAITLIDAKGERTIIVLGERLAPNSADGLPWESLSQADAVYFTAGDPDALRLARQARVLVATSRVLPLLAESGVPLDAIVGSARDPSERYQDGDLEPPPRLVVRTAGGSGGTFQIAGGPEQEFSPVPVPGPVEDSYGCGDSFAAGLTYALGVGYGPEEAVALAARCGAAALTGRGPYEGQMSLSR